jgi:hypothetical protein
MNASRLELNSAGWRNVSGLTQQSRMKVGMRRESVEDWPLGLDISVGYGIYSLWSVHSVRSDMFIGGGVRVVLTPLGVIWHNAGGAISIAHANAHIELLTGLDPREVVRKEECPVL